jgi:hypothetical protein
MAKIIVNDPSYTPTPIAVPAPPMQPAPTPSQAIIRAAMKGYTVTDTLGRKLGVRLITPSVRQRLRAMAGPELARNEQWMAESILAFAVSSIDSEPVVVNNLRELEVHMDDIGAPGLVAVSESYFEHFGTGEVTTADTIKN